MSLTSLKMKAPVVELIAINVIGVHNTQYSQPLRAKKINKYIYIETK